MNLNFLFGYQNNTSATNSNSVSGNVFQATGPPADMNSFKAGQTIQGEVVATRNNEVILQLEDGGQINAKLTKDIPINIGQTMTFEVKSNNGFRLSLSPLFENMGHDPNALKALNAAGLPDNARNLQMVSLMMRQGLPVDKNSLLNFSRQMNLNPTANPATLAQMNRLDIPTSPENIRQFEAYKNYEHQISSSVREITDGLIKDIGQMVSRGDNDSAASLFKQVLNIFNQDNQANNLNPNVLGNQTNVMNPQANIQMITGDDILRLIGEQARTETQITTPVTTQLADFSLPNTNPNQESIMQTDTLTQNQLPVQNQPNPALNLALDVPNNESANTTQVTLSPQLQITENTFMSLLELSPENRQQLATLLGEAGFSNELTNLVNNPNLNQNTLIAMLNHELTQNPGLFDNTKLAQLLGSRIFQAVIKNDINNQWLIRPEDVSRERYVEEHFNKIFEQTNKLLEALNSSGRGETQVAQSTANLSNNLSFVNQLNQMFTYIQLPLKMGGENTHAELFVYTNKKNLAQKDGNVSALLHLDMEHLGPMDVYIAMQNNNVSTKFYLASEQVIDLIAQHIHILNDRLTERGYATKSEFVNREPDKRPIDEIMEATKNIPILATYSFDARA